MDYYVILPVLKAALSGVLVAASADIKAFRSWKSYEEARTYDWRVAAWSWFQGAVVGVLAYYGVGVVL